MSINLRFPNITGHTEAEQIAQIKSYLHQLVEQLNWALPSIESGSGAVTATSTENPSGDVSAESFYELKSLIIKSSDMLNAYYEKINKKLESQYVSQADFDAYKLEPKYVLPVGGAEIGGVKNGGNVVIGEDGTMSVEIPECEEYVLPVGGTELGGVKNGGNVTIQEDGTLTADIPSDEHIIQLINSVLGNTD